MNTLQGHENDGEQEAVTSDTDANDADTRGADGSWRSLVTRFISESSDSTAGVAGSSEPTRPTFTQLALQFEAREMIPRTLDRWNGPTSRAVKAGQDPESNEYQLGVRPVLGTKRGWARGSLTWSNIGHQGGRLSLDPAQQRWFRQFYAMHRAATTVVVGQDANWVFIDEFVSPALWSLLTQAEELGIALVSATTFTPVLVYDAAEIYIDATAAASAAYRLAPKLQLGGTEMPFGETGAIGDHGLYIAAREGDRQIHLAPVRAGLSAAERSILTAPDGGAEFTLPATDLAVFLEHGIPAIRAGFRIESTDGSVDLPEPPPATAVLTAAWRKNHRLSMNWSVEGPAGAAAPEVNRLLPDALFEAGLLPPGWIPTEREAEGDEPEFPASPEDAVLPPDAELSGADVAAFLVHAVPALQRVPGVEVRVTGDPPVYQHASATPKLTLTTVPSEKEDWFDLGVLVTVDEKTVPFAPLFKALASGKKKLLLVDHTYLDLRHPAFAPLAELIAEAQDLDEWETGLRISKHQVDLWAEFEDLADESVAATEWRDLVAEAAGEYPQHVVLSAGLRAELRPYQLEGFYWLAFLWRNRLGGILADDMGLGKTLQCLALITHAKEGGSQPPEHRPFLVVAPTSVMSNWAVEAARFAPDLRVRVRTATEGTSGRSVQLDAGEADIIVTSYALFRLEYDQFREVAEDPALGFAGLILDEAQFVKNMRSQGNELAEQLPVKWKLAVTGTPMENSLRELHAICRIVAPGLFPSARKFEEEYVRPIEQTPPGISTGVGAGSGPETQAQLRERRTERLRRRLRPFMLRRSKQLVAAELPLKQEQVLEIELEPGHREIYDVFLQRERQKLYGLITDLDRNRFTVFRSLTLLRMLALDASLIDEQYADLPSAKLDVLVAHVTELAQEGRRVLVFSQFTSFLDRARHRLQGSGLRTVTLEGRTRDRDGVIRSFREGEVDVFLISLKAGGVGLNLTEADSVFLLDPWWNPASEAQAIDRTHRIGQDKPVHVFRMIALGTIEEKVYELQQRKRALFGAVIDNEDLFAKTLTAADVKAILG